VSRHIHSPAALPREEDASSPTGWEAGWTSLLVWSGDARRITTPARYRTPLIKRVASLHWHNFVSSFAKIRQLFQKLKGGTHTHTPHTHIQEAWWSHKPTVSVRKESRRKRKYNDNNSCLPDSFKASFAATWVSAFSSEVGFWVLETRVLYWFRKENMDFQRQDNPYSICSGVLKWRIVPSVWSILVLYGNELGFCNNKRLYPVI
jgi:hypothetical protein